MVIWIRRRNIKLSRLTEKLQNAGGVVARATAKLEAEADALIAREQELANKTKLAFTPHHQLLDSHNKDLDHLEDALKIVENAAPLPAISATVTSSVGNMIAEGKFTIEDHLAAIAAGHDVESRYYFEFIDKRKANAGTGA